MTLENLKVSLMRLSTTRPNLFITLMIIAMFGAKILFSPFMVMFGGGDTTTGVVDLGIVFVLVSFAFLPVETLIGQALPIVISRRIFRVIRWRNLMLISGFIFGLLHLPAGIGGFFVGFSAGLPLACCWLVWIEQSFLKALIWTTIVHAIHNAIAFVFYGLLFL